MKKMSNNNYHPLLLTAIIDTAIIIILLLTWAFIYDYKHDILLTLTVVLVAFTTFFGFLKNEITQDDKQPLDKEHSKPQQPHHS